MSNLRNVPFFNYPHIFTSQEEGMISVIKDVGSRGAFIMQKDLFDFNPSPHSHKYYGVVELRELFERSGFNVKLYGYMDVQSVSMRQRILRPIKFLASKAKIIPGSTQGKKWLKKIVFGGLVEMPAEIKGNAARYVEPDRISATEPDKMHKVIYCEATLE